MLTGQDVVKMVTGPACTVVVLTRGSQNGYTIRQVMNVTTLKVRPASRLPDRPYSTASLTEPPTPAHGTALGICRPEMPRQIIVGNPIDSPALNVTNRLERLFNGEGALACSSGKGRQH